MLRRSPRTVLTALAVTATSLVLAGCFSVESSFTINDDATADIEYVVLVDTGQLEEFSSMLGEDFGDMGDMGDMSSDALLEEMMGGEDPCGDLAQDMADFDVTSEEIQDGDQVGVRCSVTGVPLDDLNASMQDDESAFTIEQDDTGTRFTARLEGVDELTGDASEMTSMLDIDIDDIFEIVFNVSAPGSLGENNATSTDGSTATWSVTPDADFVVAGDAEMNAEWTPGSDSSSSSTIWIILGIIAAVLIIGGLVFFLMKRGKSDDAPDGSNPEGGGTDVPGATTPPFTPPTATDVPPPPPAADTPPTTTPPTTTMPAPPAGPADPEAPTPPPADTPEPPTNPPPPPPPSV